MALDLEFLKLVVKHLNANAIDNLTETKQVLSLGYPDLLLKKKCLEYLSSNFNLNDIPFHSQTEKILRWHGAIDCLPVFDAHIFFSRFGISLTVSDFKQHRGDEIILDLNLNVPKVYFDSFDAIIDSGTLEHLFFPSMGFLNAFRMLKSGGIFFHAAPVTRINHGFWSFNPVFYKDFCAVNDVKILESFLVGRDKNGNPVKFNVPWSGRGQFPNGLAIIVVFKKGANYSEVIPVQSKYLQ